MIISEEIKQKIKDEYNSFKDKQYAGKSLEERKKKDQFFTPASISISMIEGFKCKSFKDKIILDPCCGSGNLLAACIIAGADPKNIYGNGYDPDMVILCKERLNNLCDSLHLSRVPEENIHQGDALKDDCLTPRSFEKGVRKDNNFRNLLW